MISNIPLIVIGGLMLAYGYAMYRVGLAEGSKQAHRWYAEQDSQQDLSALLKDQAE